MLSSGKFYRQHSDYALIMPVVKYRIATVANNVQNDLAHEPACRFLTYMHVWGLSCNKFIVLYQKVIKKDALELVYSYYFSGYKVFFVWMSKKAAMLQVTWVYEAFNYAPKYLGMCVRTNYICVHL